MRILVVLWLFFIPLFQVLLDDNLTLVYGQQQAGQCLGDQRFLLLQFKKELNFTNSTKLIRWDKNQNCCSWDGVECDSSGRVISLDLNNETILDGIQNSSSSLFRLQYLERLNLAYNNFRFTQIPINGFGNLNNLTYLNLSNSGFIGQIPADMGTLTRLVTLDLSTRFPGTQPLKLENPNLKTFVENLRDLRALYLDGVNISANGSEWCTALSSLSNLNVLSLGSCRLSGPIDSSLAQLRSLSVLLLDNNNISATVPDFFAGFSNLTVLSLSDCNLQGRFPEQIFQVRTLQILDLSRNSITGSVPEITHSGSFTKIVLSQTNFSGSLPESIGNLVSLAIVDLSNCHFNGSIPSAMGNLTELRNLDFSWNNLTSTIPLFLMSKRLKYLDLSHNYLTGPIRSNHFEGLTELSNINLAYNALSGGIPSSLFALPSLQQLFLSNNQFDGEVSEFSSASASQLDTLDFSSNQLNGSLPKSFFQLRNLSVLSLSSNNFNGTIRLEMIKSLPNLARLELSYNNLSIDVRSSDATISSFPQLSVLKLASSKLQEFPDLRNQSRMFYLDLSENNITGEVPKWIWEVGQGKLNHLNLSCNHLVNLQENYTIPSLGVLDLHANQLQGKFPIPPLTATYVDYSTNNFSNSIPPNIGEYMSVAYFFSLANNNLSGVIPTSICNATYLQVLDLSNNSLTGSIPECLVQNMEFLGVLNLARNQLNGTIPDRFEANCVLKTLDISRNLIPGQIPGSLINCKLLEVLNVGTNQIEDNFPCKLRSLSSLRVLVLRSNIFWGDLHCKANDSWPNLQIIDIASNKFNGSLSAGCFLTWGGMMKDEHPQSQLNHLRLDVLALSHLYYQDTVTVTMKGQELELKKILTVFTSIDFSSNEFKGSIPPTVGELKALYVLNLSHNALTGAIPLTIGKLTQLGSLDLSKNQLTGTIPSELGNLTFLSFLNLSYNNLSGKVPPGRQLQTFSEISFEGNMELCGFPLNTSCKHIKPVPDPSKASTNEHSASQAEFDWQFIFTGLGFGVGAAIILAPLIVCKEGRERCDEYLENFFLKIFPAYHFSYTRYDEGKVEAVENFEDDTTEDSDEDQYKAEDETFRGRYCVFCTKLDAHRKKALHNPKCNCHTSPLFSPSPTSSSSLLALYQQNF